MAELNFPQDRTELVPPGTGDLQTGDTYTSNGQTWVYDADAKVWNSGGGAAISDTYDGRYLRVDAAAGDQIRLSGEANFRNTVSLGPNKEIELNVNGSATFGAGGANNVYIYGDGSADFKGLTTHEGGVRVSGGKEVEVVDGIVKRADGHLDIIRDSNRVIRLANADNYKLSLQPKVDGATGTAGYGCVFSPRITNSEFTTAVHTLRSQPNLEGLKTPLLNYFAASYLTSNTKPTEVDVVRGFTVDDTVTFGTNSNVGYYSSLTAAGDKNYNFYASGDAPNFLTGSTYIGGNTTRNTFELWKSTLTEQQLEQLEAGTLVAPANVATPGAGEFARQWWYNQQSAEDQALIDSGELDYPEHFAASTFTDTFDLGDNTRINLYSNGLGEFKGGVQVSGGSSNVTCGITSGAGSNYPLFIRANGTEVARFTDKAGGTVYGVNLLVRNSIIDSTVRSATGYYSNFKNTNLANVTTARGFSTYLESNADTTDSCDTFVGFSALSSDDTGFATNAYGFESKLNTFNATECYNFYASGDAPNFLAGSTYIGGNTTRTTFDLWKSTLTEEQLEQLEAGTLVAPANVSTPGDGTFARQWWYDQQDAETQAAIDSGDLDYPEHLAAATFTDTFVLGDNTDINLSSTGRSLFRKPLTTSNYFAVAVEDQISPNPITGDKTGISLRNNGQVLINVRDAASVCIGLRRNVDGGFINFNNNSTTEINTLGVSNGVLNFSDQVSFSGLTEHEGGVKVTGGAPSNVVDGIVKRGSGNVEIIQNSNTVILLSSADNFKLSLQPKINGATGTTGYGCVLGPKIENSEFTTGVHTIRSQPRLQGLKTPFLNFFSASYLPSEPKPTEVNVSRGFLVTEDIDFGTNQNIGFQSNLSAAGTKNYNFYAAGDAPNYLAGGVQFDNTGNAGSTGLLMKDYEEGTFTAEFIEIGTTNITYTNNYGNYTICGNVCTVTYFISWENCTNQSTNQIKLPLPFQAFGNKDSYRSAAALGYCKGISFNDQLIVTLSGNATIASMWTIANNGGAARSVAYDSLGGAGEIQTTVIYQIK